MRRDKLFPLQQGVTLIEMIVAIVVTGILVSLTSMFVRNQIESYTDVARRVDLVDMADGAVRRMARDLQNALPNSPRTPGSNCVEFIPTKTGGRYRTDSDGSAGSEYLDFTAADSKFNMYGPMSGNAAQQIAIGDLVAVYNLGITGANAFEGDNTAAVVAPAPSYSATSKETTINIASKLFPLASANNRFHVIPSAEQAVSYVCLGAGVSAAGDGQGTLYRLVKTLPYPMPAGCPASVPAGTPVLASNIGSCVFTYTPGTLQRTGLVSIALDIRRAGEPVAIHQQVNVTNTP